MRVLVALLFVGLLGGCSEKPKHYYVLCTQTNLDGWSLVSVEEDNNGYIMACTYQSPDKQRYTTGRCTKNGCD